MGVPKTQPDLFIIESLSKADEVAERFEGQRLANILRLSGKNPRYFYFQSKEELPLLLELFQLSKYRFLHVSCHASAGSVFTTSDEIQYADLGKTFAGSLKLKRLFFSACEAGNELLSTCIAGTNKGMHSIVAPAEQIAFDHAAAIWGAFYVSMFAGDANAMEAVGIERRLKLLCTLFPVDFHLSSYSPTRDAWRHQVIHKKSINSPSESARAVS